MTAERRSGLRFVARCLIPLGVIALAVALSTPDPAEAVIERVYTLPFYDNFQISCGFGCYAGHAGVDYELGVFGAGGERVAAAAGGTAENCPFSSTAGWYMVMDHGDGHHTRYLHLNG